MKIKTVSLLLTAILVFIGCSSDSKTLSIKPSAASFGDINIGDKAEIVLTMKNKYGKEIVVQNMILTGSSDFSITSGGNFPFSMLSNEEYSVTIEFEPTTSGDLASLLTISTDASQKDKEVQLSGSGIPVPRIELSETNYDFGKKLINKTHTHDFVIKNVGTASMDISNLSFTGTGASLYSITAGNAPVNIQPGNNHTFTVSFSPTVLGTFPADLNVSHNAVNEISPLIVNVTGEGIDLDPQITLSVGNSWDFGSVATTIPSIQICEIENTGIDPLTVSSATLTTGAEFVVDSLTDSNGNPLNFPQTIAVGAKILLAVKFTPTANSNYNDTLTFVHDGTNENSPFSISLSGNGRAEVSKTFSYTGAVQQWTVPAGVTALVVECYGARGGDSGNSAFGANGGMAKAKVPVTPGDTVYFYVGGKGGVLSSGPSGGWNGGGGTASTTSQPAGSGGGASDIRVGGTALADRKVVAGGGGGGGFQGTVANGGAGGGLTGDNGSQWSSYPPGDGGTQIAGGAGGSGSTWGQPSATSGVLGVGGNGQGWSGGGGGGGGGYYGGGGGFISGGGGGSSYYDAPGNTDKSTQKGVRSGDGEIIIKY